MTAFAIRNLKLYFRDRGAVFFSLLAVIITFGLYVLFLGDVYTQNLAEQGIPAAEAKEIMDHWVMAGIIAEAGVTISHGVLEVIIADKARRITKDFYVSPVKHSALTGGYLICAFVVSILMISLTFVLTQAYILLSGGAAATSPAKLPAVFGVIFLVSFASAGMMSFFVSIFKSQQAYASASSIVGTLIGFVMGIYLPVGMYPSVVQWIIRCFPISHGAVLLRQIMMDDVMEEAFAGMPAPVLDKVCESFGVTYYFGDFKVTPLTSICILLVTGIVFMALACMNLGKKQKI